MKVVTFVGNQEKIIKKASEELNASINEMFYNIEEEKNILKKSKIVACTKFEVAEEVENYLKKIIKDLGIDVDFQKEILDNKIILKMSSSNNSILIGKNGRTLESLKTLATAYISNNYGLKIYLLLDVEDYQEIRKKRLESMAIKIAKEVQSANIETTLENMNSYERRIIHNVLKDFNGVTTESLGDEPNRHIIIKPSSK